MQVFAAPQLAYGMLQCFLKIVRGGLILFQLVMGNPAQQITPREVGALVHAGGQMGLGRLVLPAPSTSADRKQTARK